MLSGATKVGYGNPYMCGSSRNRPNSSKSLLSSVIGLTAKILVPSSRTILNNFAVRQGHLICFGQ